MCVCIYIHTQEMRAQTVRHHEEIDMDLPVAALLILFGLIAFVQSRHSKDIAFLRSVEEVQDTITNRNISENIDKTGENGIQENKKNETDIPRDSRGLMKKFGYLTGMKGGLISSSGTLAASNSLRIFGKVMNTALSVSYGHVNDVDTLPEIESDQSHGSNDSSEKEGRLKPEFTTAPSLKSIRKQFLKTHNAQVSRINHKFLRSDPFGRSS